MQKIINWEKVEERYAAAKKGETSKPMTTEWLSSEFVDKDGNKVGSEAVTGYKTIMVLHARTTNDMFEEIATNSPTNDDCLPLKNKLKDIYDKINEGGKKELQIV